MGRYKGGWVHSLPGIPLLSPFLSLKEACSSHVKNLSWNYSSASFTPLHSHFIKGILVQIEIKTYYTNTRAGV
jgi:hypothetical protein